jgi:hypothetical protein
MQSDGAKSKEEREICCMYVGMSARRCNKDDIDSFQPL